MRKLIYTRCIFLGHAHLPQVWISYARFELSVDAARREERSRHIFEEGNRSLRGCEEREERLMLLEAWRDFEVEHGTEEQRQRVARLMPKRVKKRRKVQADDGVSNFSSSGFLIVVTLVGKGKGKPPYIYIHFFFFHVLHSGKLPDELGNIWWK